MAAKKLETLLETLLEKLFLKNQVLKTIRQLACWFTPILLLKMPFFALLLLSYHQKPDINNTELELLGRLLQRFDSAELST